MTTAERLVSQIREFVNGVEHTATPEIAELAHYFHDACRTLNQRLAKCNDFLRQGMRSEAVQEALAKPSVFELAETFSFKEKTKWQRICHELELPAPPEIDSATVERLKNECGQEELLAPLLHEYRRLVHTGSRDQKIHILRRIRSHDQDNPVWTKNLEPLEKEEIKDLERRAEEALQNEDEDEVSDVLNSLRAPWRAVEAPSELTDKLENWLARRRRKAAEKEGEKILTEVNEKLHQRDLSGLARKLAEWDRLLEHPDFKSTEKMRNQAAQARNWCQSETNRQQRRQEYKQRKEALFICLEPGGRHRHKHVIPAGRLAKYVVKVTSHCFSGGIKARDSIKSDKISIPGS